MAVVRHAGAEAHRARDGADDLHDVTLPLAVWRGSAALRKSYEECQNCSVAFRSEAGCCPTCGMLSQGQSPDLVPAALERAGSSSRYGQRLLCLQGHEQPVALLPAVPWDSMQFNAVTSSAARTAFMRPGGRLHLVEPELRGGAASFDDFLAMRTTGYLRFRTAEQVQRFVDHPNAVGLVCEFVSRMGQRVEVQRQDGVLEYVQVPRSTHAAPDTWLQTLGSFVELRLPCPVPAEPTKGWLLQ